MPSYHSSEADDSRRSRSPQFKMRLESTQVINKLSVEFVRHWTPAGPVICVPGEPVQAAGAVPVQLNAYQMRGTPAGQDGQAGAAPQARAAPQDGQAGAAPQDGQARAAPQNAGQPTADAQGGQAGP